MLNRQASVIKEYRSAYPNPVTIMKNEIVNISHCDLQYRGWIWVQQTSGNAGVAPQQLFSLHSTTLGICREDYTAHELSVNTGENLILEKKLNGWYRARTSSGETGWIPEECVRLR